MPYGARPDDWINLDLLGLTADLLPVVSNPNAPISPKSSLKSLGKVPSRYNSNRQIVGIPDWTQHQTTAKDIEHWQQEPDYGICIQTRFIRALDIDVTGDTAQRIPRFIAEFLKFALPVRYRSNSPKCLLPFILKGTYPKRVMTVEGGIIEFLANGQHFVAIGTHPSGARYEGLENVNAFPELTPEQFESLWSALASQFALEPPDTASLRNPPSDPNDAILAALRDPVVAFLEERGHVTGLGKEGQIYLRCPWEAEHSELEKKEGTSTAYLPAGNREYQQGHFSCLHAHCAKRADEEFLDAYGVRAADFNVIPDTPEETQEKAQKAARFAPTRAGDYSNRPEVKWLIKGILPERGAYQWYGGSGDGKTFAVLDMMLSFCRGLDWNGHKTTRKGRVVYLCAEGAGGFISRLKAYGKHHDISDLNTLDFWVVTDTPNFRTMDDIKLLANQINVLGGIDITVFDTLIKISAGADENSAKDMGVLLRHFDKFRELTNAGAGYVHHSGKDATKGARGSTALKGDLDAQFCISRNEDGTRSFWVDKLKDGRDGFGYNFTLETVSFGTDEDGDILDSCVIKYLSLKTTKKKDKPKTERRLGKHQQFIWDIFTELGQGGEVFHQTLKEEALRRMPPAAKNTRDRRYYRVDQTLDSMIENGQFNYNNETCMLTAPL